LWGVGGCVHPDELFDRLTSRQMVGWIAWATHFSTPLNRSDLNSALERQAMLIPHCKAGRAPSVNDLLVKYGKATTRKKKPRDIFRIAEAAFITAGAGQKNRE
jgi:hypothetical protein